MKTRVANASHGILLAFREIILSSHAFPITSDELPTQTHTGDLIWLLLLSFCLMRSYSPLV
jgi:hypothetical protein